MTAAFIAPPAVPAPRRPDSSSAPTARPAVGELLVVDLASAGAALPVLRRMAQRAAARRGSERRLVLFDTADGEGFTCEGAATVLSTADVLTGDRGDDAQRWIDDAARTVVDGALRDCFPTWRGVHMGDLNRLTAQVRLTTFATIAGALAELLRTHRVERCTILSARVHRARSLAEFARGCGAAHVRIAGELPARVAGVIRGAHRLLRRDGTPASHPDIAAALPDRPVTGLLVSESTPQSQMFEVVERALRDEAEGDWLRVQYGTDVVSRTEGSTTVIAPGRPLVVPARRRGRFAAAWRTVRARRVSLAAPLAGVPLEVPWQDVLEIVFQEELDRQVEHLDEVAAVLDRTRPAVVVVGNDRWWVGLAWVLVARARGIPTICVQDGLAGDIAYWWWVGADRFAANGDDQRRVMLREGVAPERVVTTGQPRYDDIWDRTPAAATRGVLGVPDDAVAVLFATQPHQQPAYVEAVVDALLAVPRVTVLLRPHPSEPQAKYDAILAARPDGRLILQRAGSVFDVIVAADVLVTEFSTVALEAAMLGRPVVTATFGARPAPVQFDQLGIATSARSPEALTERVAALTLPAVRRAGAAKAEARARDLFGPTDGRSASRVVALVRSLVDTSAAGAA